MVRMINAFTKTDMWVADDRVNEYKAAGHILPSDSEKPTVEEKPEQEQVEEIEVEETQVEEPEVKENQGQRDQKGNQDHQDRQQEMRTE